MGDVKMQLYKHQQDALAATVDRNRVAISGYEGLYTVDDAGNVYSEITGKTRRKGVLKPYTKNGYFAVNLFKNGKSKHFYVHRLIAMTFIPNPNNCRYINHIDCDKKNNDVSNLEWCTQKQNIHEAMKNGLERHTAVKITDLRTSKTTEFYSMRKASAFFRKYPNFISLERKKHGNSFTFSGYRIEVI